MANLLNMSSSAGRPRPSFASPMQPQMMQPMPSQPMPSQQQQPPMHLHQQQQLMPSQQLPPQPQQQMHPPAAGDFIDYDQLSSNGGSMDLVSQPMAAFQEHAEQLQQQVINDAENPAKNLHLVRFKKDASLSPPFVFESITPVDMIKEVLAEAEVDQLPLEDATNLLYEHIQTDPKSVYDNFATAISNCYKRKYRDYPCLGQWIDTLLNLLLVSADPASANRSLSQVENNLRLNLTESTVIDDASRERAKSALMQMFKQSMKRHKPATGGEDADAAADDSQPKPKRSKNSDRGGGSGETPNYGCGKLDPYIHKIINFIELPICHQIQTSETARFRSDFGIVKVASASYDSQKHGPFRPYVRVRFEQPILIRMEKLQTSTAANYATHRPCALDRDYISKLIDAQFELPCSVNAGELRITSLCVNQTATTIKVYLNHNNSSFDPNYENQWCVVREGQIFFDSENRARSGYKFYPELLNAPTKNNAIGTARFLDFTKM